MSEFSKKTEAKAREEILSLVSEYADTYHGSAFSASSFTPGDRIPYAGRVYDREEMVALVDSALSFWLTAGDYAARFEEGLSDYLGIPYTLAVSSGSSANLLSFMALTAPELGERAIRRGDEVITVAAGFPTTVSPIINFGAVPVFADISIPSYNIDVSFLEEALSPRTKAVMIAHTLGNPFNLRAVRDFCDRFGLWLIEDNCDALGSRYFLDGKWHMTGTIGDIGTSSFYPPHHMTMGQGGAVYTSSPVLNRILLSMRDWGRDCICRSGEDGRCGHRFDASFGTLPFGYDHKYVYSHFGYNLSITDMQAALGTAQLKKLSEFCSRRRANWAYLREELKDLTDYIILPEPEPDSDPSWFGFAMTLKEGINRREILKRIEESGVQTRLLFAGNILRQPCFTAYEGAHAQDAPAYRVVGDLHATDRVMEQTFWVGVYPGMDGARLSYMAKAIREALTRGT